jgi:hypothetical protein
LNKIFMSPKDMKFIKSELELGKKISAIKKVRSCSMGENGRGLKEAKIAVERFMIEHDIVDQNQVHIKIHPDACRLVTWNPIRRIVIDMGDGEMEVDMEEFQFKILTMEGGVSVDSVGHMIDLLGIIKKWENNLENGLNL